MRIEEMEMTLRIELKAAEGGADARDLVKIQAGIYAKYCERRGL